MMVTNMQTDTEPDRVQNEIIQKEQAAEDIIRSLHKQFTIFTNKILPPDKQQCVPGRDTGESQGPIGVRTLTVTNLVTPWFLGKLVSRVATQNSLRGVGVESKPYFL